MYRLLYCLSGCAFLLAGLLCWLYFLSCLACLLCFLRARCVCCACLPALLIVIIVHAMLVCFLAVYLSAYACTSDIEFRVSNAQFGKDSNLAAEESDLDQAKL